MIITPHSNAPHQQPKAAVPPARRTGLMTVMALLLAILAIRAWRHEPTTNPAPPPPVVTAPVTDVPVIVPEQQPTSSIPTVQPTLVEVPKEPPLTAKQKEINELLEKNKELQTIRNDQYNNMRDEVIENSKRPPEERSPLAPTEQDLINFKANPNLISG